VDTGFVDFTVDGTRILLVLAGLLAVGGGLLSYRQMDDRAGVPVVRDLLSALRGDTTTRRRLSKGGMLIAFEGGEGSGKSTQAARLAEWHTERGVAVTTTHEPGATDFGVRIRQILLDSPDGSLSPRAEALLFAADRAHHVDTVIRPALERGDVVITDRYVDSSLAYQGAGRALSMDDVRRLSRWATSGLRPDLTVLLDVDPEVGLARARSSGGERDRLERESLEFHQRVRHAFRALADAAPDNYLVVDASRHPEAVAAVVRAAVAKRLAARLASQRQPKRADREGRRRLRLRRPRTDRRGLLRRAHQRSPSAVPSPHGGPAGSPPTLGDIERDAGVDGVRAVHDGAPTDLRRSPDGLQSTNAGDGLESTNAGDDARWGPTSGPHDLAGANAGEDGRAPVPPEQPRGEVPRGRQG
jgi:dTMP kinase